MDQELFENMKREIATSRSLQKSLDDLILETDTPDSDQYYEAYWALKHGA